MKKWLFIGCMLTASSAFAQTTNTVQDNLTARKSLTLGTVKVTAIQKDTAFADSTKLPTSKAVKQFVEGRIVGGASGLTVGTTTIASGTTGRILYNKSGVLRDTVQYVEARCILKPSTDGAGNITWAFINDSDHQPVYFDSVYTDASSGRLTVRYPAVSKVLSFNVNTDESFARIPMQVGASVGLTTTTIWMYKTTLWSANIVGNGTSTYTLNPGPPSILQPYPSGGGAFTMTYDSASGVVTLTNVPYQDADSEFYTLGLEYEGDSSYRVQRIWTGLSYRMTKFKLISNTTNTVVHGAPSVNTRIIVRGPIVMSEIPGNSSSTGARDYPGFFMKNNGSYLPNFWVTATFIK